MFVFEFDHQVARVKAKQPVRLSSRGLSQVCATGHLPEHKTAGVHVDPVNRENLIGGFQVKLGNDLKKGQFQTFEVLNIT